MSKKKRKTTEGKILRMDDHLDDMDEDLEPLLGEDDVIDELGEDLNGILAEDEQEDEQKDDASEASWRSEDLSYERERERGTAEELTCFWLPESFPRVPGFTFWPYCWPDLGATFYYQMEFDGGRRLRFYVGCVRGVAGKAAEALQGNERRKKHAPDYAAQLPRGMQGVHCLAVINAYLADASLALPRAVAGLAELLHRTTHWALALDFAVAELHAERNVVCVCSCAQQPQVAVIRGAGGARVIGEQDGGWHLPLGPVAPSYPDNGPVCWELGLGPGDCLVLYLHGILPRRDGVAPDRYRAETEKTLVECRGASARETIRAVVFETDRDHEGNIPDPGRCAIVLQRD